MPIRVIPHRTKNDDFFFTTFESVDGFDFNEGNFEGAVFAEGFRKMIDVWLGGSEEMGQEMDLGDVGGYYSNVIASYRLGSWVAARRWKNIRVMRRKNKK